MLPILKSISMHMKSYSKEVRDTIGINICALKMIKKEMNQKKENDEQLDFSRPGEMEWN
jgi:hypothetical protein